MKRKELLILYVLKNSEVPITSARIGEENSETGYEMSERTIRLYLQKIYQAGLTNSSRKLGHYITGCGLTDHGSSAIKEKSGFLPAKIDQMTYKMNFDLNTSSGYVAINLTIAELWLFAEKIPEIKKVYAAGYAMENPMKFLGPGESLGHINVL
jgi:HTH-type transcriptional regulator, global nitrogen regulator NrpRI